ncbi:threonine/serine exporter family protein [Salimicrobium sp. PL1-032A]|uniref:threonine/serine exporter family protein n=1 Tax=Salimicrobium sp. PL1-032A TaxID=3095364 RepID=UPI0032602789
MERTEDLIELCLFMGKIMQQNGAETYRVEDTMTRIAESFGRKESQSYVTPTGIMFTISPGAHAKLVRVSARETNLEKVNLANDVSRKIASGDMSIHAAYKELRHIETSPTDYTMLVQIISATLASGFFTIMFRGSWHDFLPACVAGGLGFIALINFLRLFEIKFVAEFVASLLIGFTAFSLFSFGIGEEVDKIVVGSIMPLVPGLLITNAVRDLMAGHLISGLAKGAEAFLTAFAIGPVSLLCLHYFRDREG